MAGMSSKSNSEIMNQWWANGIPLGTPGGASGSVSHIGSATVFLAAGDSNIGNVDIVTLPALEKTTPIIYNVTVASGSEEYPRGLPANCRALQFRCRQEADIRYAFETGKVATAMDPYMTLFADEIYSESGLKLAAATLYLGAASPALVVEVEVWT